MTPPLPGPLPIIVPVPKRPSVALKLLAVAALSILIIIAVLAVDFTISDRQSYRNQAVASISQSYASDQRVLGPIYVQPFRTHRVEDYIDDKNNKKTREVDVDDSLRFFPTDLTVKGEITPSMRRHGLYQVPVYEMNATMNGHFDVPASLPENPVKWGVPYLAWVVKDARGIVGVPVLQMAGTSYKAQGSVLSPAEQISGVGPVLPAGADLRVILPQYAGKGGSFDFSLGLTLAGTQTLEMVPIANANHFELHSTWAAPLFAGHFLPRTREITPQGFHAQWEVSSLATSAQQNLTSGSSEQPDVISVELANPIDPYKLSDRAAKYGILFVLLTFGSFFLFEMIKRMLIHPVQYLLVGFCLAIFFLLLISFSEHMPFGLAYTTATAACIGLLTYYLVFVLRSRLYGSAFGGALLLLYAAIYGLLISEDNALLLGSLLLFAVLAGIMITTRKIDWYQRADAPEPPPVIAPPYDPLSPPAPPAGYR